MTYTERSEIFKDTTMTVCGVGLTIGSRADVSAATVNDGTNLAPYDTIGLLPFREREDRASGNVRCDVNMWFVGQDSTNNNLDETDQLIGRMYDVKDSWLAEFESRIWGRAAIEGVVLATPERKTFPGFRSGYSLAFTMVYRKSC